MAVSNGQTADETTFNAAFISKTATTGNTCIGIVDLNNSSDSSSGARITNAQKAINNNGIDIPSTATIAASGTISLTETYGRHVIQVVGDAGAVNMSTTPFGTSGTWLDGTEVSIIGTSDTNTVTIANNDAANGAITNGTATLKKYYMITYIWVSDLSRWIEKTRNF